MQSYRQSEFCTNSVSRIRPRLADRATHLGDSPHLSCKRYQIKMRDYMDGLVPSLSRLPHLPGVPHLHVNRPKVENIFIITKHSGLNSLPFVSFVGRRNSAWLLAASRGFGNLDSADVSTFAGSLLTFFYSAILSQRLLCRPILQHFLANC